MLSINVRTFFRTNKFSSHRNNVYANSPKNNLTAIEVLSRPLIMLSMEANLLEEVNQFLTYKGVEKQRFILEKSHNVL